MRSLVFFHFEKKHLENLPPNWHNLDLTKIGMTGMNLPRKNLLVWMKLYSTICMIFLFFFSRFTSAVRKRITSTTTMTSSFAGRARPPGSRPPDHGSSYSSTLAHDQDPASRPGSTLKQVSQYRCTDADTPCTITIALFIKCTYRPAPSQVFAARCALT